MSGHGLHDLGDRLALDEDVVDARDLGVVLDAERGAGVPLGVEVDDEHGAAGLGQGRRDVDRRRRLADPALLVRHGEHPGTWWARDGPTAQGDAPARVLGDRQGERGVLVGTGHRGRDLGAVLGVVVQGRAGIHAVLSGVGGAGLTVHEAADSRSSSCGPPRSTSASAGAGRLRVTSGGGVSRETVSGPGHPKGARCRPCQPGEPEPGRRRPRLGHVGRGAHTRPPLARVQGVRYSTPRTPDTPKRHPHVGQTPQNDFLQQAITPPSVSRETPRYDVAWTTKDFCPWLHQPLVAGDSRETLPPSSDAVTVRTR